MKGLVGLVVMTMLMIVVVVFEVVVGDVTAVVVRGDAFV